MQDLKIFCIKLDHGQSAYVKYRITGSEPNNREVDFFTTFVPNEYRGMGLAAILVESAFAWAEQNALGIAASCSYVALKLKPIPGGVNERYIG